MWEKRFADLRTALLRDGGSLLTGEPSGQGGTKEARLMQRRK